jgi:hypothetical protein
VEAPEGVEPVSEAESETIQEQTEEESDEHESEKIEDGKINTTREKIASTLRSLLPQRNLMRPGVAPPTTGILPAKDGLRTGLGRHMLSED